MLTKLPEDVLADLGSRVRASYLREQAGYTLAIAAAEAAAIDANLDDNYRAEAAQCLADVEHALQDKTVAAAEATLSTSAQGAAVRNAKVWRRKVATRGARAKHKGESIPDALTTVTRAASIADVSLQVTQMLALFTQHLGVMGKGADALLAEGQTISAALATASTDQNVKHLDALPKSVRAFYALKGTLYTALKVINAAGHELHTDHPILAAGYNMKILYRHAHSLASADGAGATPATTTATPAPAAPKPATEPAK